MASTRKDIGSPLKYLRSAINNLVLVKLKDGSEFIGRLVHCDNTMNLMLEDCLEVREGINNPVAKYGRVFVRGSNILFVTLDYSSLM
ncbi:MAG TPA: Sm ribonucleo [Desulfurococcales archaeon]|nr:Sm ribonucleo [Desulfurococcales archaeon]